MRVVKHIKEDDFEIFIRKNKVILSAPHSVKQIRDGKSKVSETQTKYIAYKVSKKTNSSCIYKTKCVNDDANYDDYSYYREKCSEIVNVEGIKFLLDVHGMSAKREQDICIGVAHGNHIDNRLDILNNIVSIFNKNGFKNVSIDIPFAACGKNCVSSYIHDKCGIITFQIEINYKYLSSMYDEFDFNKIVDTLVNIVQYLINVLNNDKN